MNSSQTRRLRMLGVLILLACVSAWTAMAIPTSVFVVHCEPTHANAVMWLELTDLVDLADRYAIPLSIDFTAQWAMMILEDDSMIEAVQNWIDAGHEIGCHHHGYWGTKGRGSTWDGYTNTPVSELDPADTSCFLGTMSDYMTLLEALPGERRSGCLGTSELGDRVDYLCQLPFSTSGQALEQAISVPQILDVEGCHPLEITHALIASKERGALQALFNQADEAQMFGVVGHVYNFADFPQQFENWFAFLASVDSSGEHRCTVSEVLDGWFDAM